MTVSLFVSPVTGALSRGVTLYGGCCARTCEFTKVVASAKPNAQATNTLTLMALPHLFLRYRLALGTSPLLSELHRMISPGLLLDAARLSSSEYPDDPQQKTQEHDLFHVRAQAHPITVQ